MLLKIKKHPLLTKEDLSELMPVLVGILVLSLIVLCSHITGTYTEGLRQINGVLVEKYKDGEMYYLEVKMDSGEIITLRNFEDLHSSQKTSKWDDYCQKLQGAAIVGQRYKFWVGGFWHDNVVRMEIK